MTETQTILKASDLRIGNWVIEDDDYCQIYSVGVEKIQVTFSKNTHKDVSEGDIEPIPLTPEILEACGFYVDKECDFAMLDNFYALQFKNEKWYVVIDPKEYEIPYLHQLQNLYYALTQKELEINL